MSRHVQGTGHTLASIVGIVSIASIVSTVIKCSSHQIILVRSSKDPLHFESSLKTRMKITTAIFASIFLIQEYEQTIDEPSPRRQLDRQRRFICVSHHLLIPYSLKHAFLTEVSKNFLRTFSLFFLSVD